MLFGSLGRGVFDCVVGFFFGGSSVVRFSFLGFVGREWVLIKSVSCRLMAPGLALLGLWF